MTRFGRFAILTYYAGRPPARGVIHLESVAVIAKDGKLVSAAWGGCTGCRAFFEMSTEDSSEYERAYELDFDDRHPELRRE